MSLDGLSGRDKAATFTEQRKHRRNADIHASNGIRIQIPVFERVKTFHALDRETTVIGFSKCWNIISNAH
jgi:hypothetical protein